MEYQHLQEDISNSNNHNSHHLRILRVVVQAIIRRFLSMNLRKGSNKLIGESFLKKEKRRKKNSNNNNNINIILININNSKKSHSINKHQTLGIKEQRININKIHRQKYKLRNNLLTINSRNSSSNIKNKNKRRRKPLKTLISMKCLIKIKIIYMLKQKMMNKITIKMMKEYLVRLVEGNLILKPYKSIRKYV